MMQLLGEKEPEIMLTSDASGSRGCGGIFRAEVVSILLECYPHNQLNSGEGTDANRSCQCGVGLGMEREAILCHCDNEAVVAVTQFRYSRDDDLMHITNPLHFEAFLGFKVMAMHVHGAHNIILADELSCDNLQSFLSKVPMMETTPTLLPAPILQNLLFNIVTETLRKHSKKPATDQVRYTLF